MALVFRPTSAAAVRLRSAAAKLASKMSALGSGMANAVSGIFIVRVLKSGDDEIASVIETPLTICGAYGGIDGGYPPLAVFTAGILISRAGVLSALDTGAQKLVDGELVPWFDGDAGAYQGYFPHGTRLQVGTLPAWSAGRTTGTLGGTSLTSQSAVSVTATFGVGGDATSLTIMRLTPYTPKYRVYGFDGTTYTTVPPPPEWRARTPTGNDAPVDDLRKLCAVEFSAGALGVDGHTLGSAFGSVEWAAADASALTGISGYTSINYSIPSPQWGIAYFGWGVTRDVDTRDAVAFGSVQWVAKLEAADVPGTAAIPVYTPPAGPAWMSYDGVGYYGTPREATPAMYLLLSSTHGQLASAKATSGIGGTGALSIIRVGVPIAGDPTTLYGHGINPATGLTETGTLESVTFTYNRLTTLAVHVQPSGVTVVPLYTFNENFNGNLDELVERRWQPYIGAHTASAETHMLCVKTTVQWEVITLPVSGAGGALQGKRRHPYSPWQAASDLDYVFVAPGGAVTPIHFGVYMPWVFNDARGASTSAGAPGKLRFVAHTPSSTIAYGRSEPFCQYSPGTVAVLVTPVSAFNAVGRPIHIAIVDVASGEVLQVGPSLGVLGSDWIARVSLTCYERATEDAEGNIATHGKLLLCASGYAGTHTDGLFIITGIDKAAWLAREPSNTWGAYFGSPLAAPVIGTTMGKNLYGM